MRNQDYILSHHRCNNFDKKHPTKPHYIGPCNNGVNFNRYVLNDPVNKVDPLGLDTNLAYGYTKPFGRYTESNHLLVIMTDTVTGAQFATRAGPQSQSAKDYIPNEGFGFIRAEAGLFNKEFGKDYNNIYYTQNIGTISCDFDDAVQSAKDFAHITNANKIPYWPYPGSNSNSYAGTFVQSLTGTRHMPIHSAPGWDRGSPDPNLNYRPTSLINNMPNDF